MTILDDAVLTVGDGNFLIAPTDTAIPGDLTSPGAVWKNVGHTSIEDIFSVTSEGGDATNVSTLQNRTLRTRYSTRNDTFAFTLNQFDYDSIKLYYGKNMVDINEDGTLMGVPTSAEPFIGAFLAIFIDGENVFAFYAPKAEIYRNDDLSLSDTESLAGLPLGVKPLQSGSNGYTYAVTPLMVIQPTTATAGIPGTFGPTNALPAFDLAGLTGVTAVPATAWTTGQKVVLRDGSLAHWTSSAWAAGAA